MTDSVFKILSKPLPKVITDHPPKPTPREKQGYYFLTSNDFIKTMQMRSRTDDGSKEENMTEIVCKDRL